MLSRPFCMAMAAARCCTCSGRRLKVKVTSNFRLFTNFFMSLEGVGVRGDAAPWPPPAQGNDPLTWGRSQAGPSPAPRCARSPCTGCVGRYPARCSGWQRGGRPAAPTGDSQPRQAPAVSCHIGCSELPPPLCPTAVPTHVKEQQRPVLHHGHLLQVVAADVHFQLDLLQVQQQLELLLVVLRLQRGLQQ